MRTHVHIVTALVIGLSLWSHAVSALAQTDTQHVRVLIIIPERAATAAAPDASPAKAPPVTFSASSTLPPARVYRRGVPVLLHTRIGE